MALSIVKFIKSLLPHVEKDQILEDLRITETELNNIVIPAYNNAAAFFSKDGFNSKEAKKIDQVIRRIVKDNSYGRQPTFLHDFSIKLQKLQTNIPILITLINNEINRDVITEGISSRKAVLIRIAEKFSYISRYSLDILNLIYMYEALESKIDVSDEVTMSPAEVATAKASIENVSKLLQGYGVDTKTFEKTITISPDVILSKMDNSSVEAVYSDSEIDPLTSQLVVGFTGNPIYHVRLLIAEWQTKRYKANQEKKKVLELRLLHLQLLKEKETNPKLEQEIAYTQNRVAKIDRYLKEVEADLDIEV